MQQAEICGEVFDVDAAIEYSMEHFAETLHKKLADAELRQVTECIIAPKLREPAGLMQKLKTLEKKCWWLRLHIMRHNRTH